MTTTNNTLLTPLLAGDHNASSGIVKEWLTESVPVKVIYEEHLKPAMYRIGELWEQNKISVATEHVASAIVESLLNEIYLHLNFSAKTGKTAIVTCLENEYHQIGARMVSDLFELQGWNVLFLGANTPQKDLLEYINIMSPNLVCISLSIYFHLPTLQSTLEEIRKLFPDIPVVTGGQAFTKGGSEVVSACKNTFYLPDLSSIENFLNTTN